MIRVSPDVAGSPLLNRHFMTSIQSRALPPPSNWQDFERLCFDLFARFWKTSDAQFNGRSGQAQAGVDVYGTDRTEGRFTGVQCKGKDGDYGIALKASELEAEVEKAKKFVPALEVFILATTAPDDVALQALARQITKVHQPLGLFEVRVEGWAILKQKLTDYVDVVEKHFHDLAPVRIESQIASSEAAVRGDLAQLAHGQQDMSRLLTSILEKSSDAASTDDPIQKQVDLLTAVINQGDADAALKQLHKLEIGLPETTSPRLRYRIRATLGSALLILDRRSQAAEAFAAASAMDPEWPGAIAIGATAALLEGRREDATSLAEKSLQRDPNNAQAATVLTDAALDDISADSLADRFDPDLLGRLDILVSLSLRASRLGDDEAARRFAEKAFAIDPEDWRSLSSVAETLLKPILSTMDVAISHRVAPEQQANFETALSHLRKAWAVITARSDAHRGIHIALNLISALDISGASEEAGKILANALAIEPASPDLLRRLAQDQVAIDDWRGVRSTLDSMPEDQRSETDLLLGAQTNIHLGDPEAGLRLAQQVEASASLDRLRDLAASMQIEAGAALGQGSEIAAELMARYAASIVIRSVAVAFLPAGDPTRAKALEEIAVLIKSASDPRDFFHAAEAFFAAGRFAEAADLYGPVAAIDKDTLPLRRLIISLHNAGQRREARELFERIPADIRANRRYAEIGAAIYQQSGLLAEAKALLEITLAADPDDLEARLHWMNITERLGRSDEVRAWLATVPAGLQGEADQLMQIAGAMDRLGVGGAILPIAYRALRRGYSNPRIHTTYTIGLFITGQTGREDLTAPELCGPDVAVTLKLVDGDKRLSYLLETEPDPRIERQEIGPDSLLWAQLEGLKVGDVIELSNLGPTSIFYEVEELSSKYLYAHFRSLREFAILFPGDKTLGQFEFQPEKGIEGVAATLGIRQRADQGRQIEDFYRSGSLPIALFAKLAGRPAFEIWDAIVGHPDLILMTCVGSEEEAANAKQKIFATKEAVVDPITLYGLVRMGIADEVLGAFETVGIVQGCLDLLRGLVDDRREDIRSSGGSLQAVGDRYALVEHSEAWARQKISDAAAVLAYAERLVVFPSEASHPIAGEALNFFEALPGAYIDTVFAAQAPDRLLLCDDRAFRLLAEGSGGDVAGVWSQAAIGTRAEAGTLALSSVAEAICAFLRAGSAFTMTPTQVLQFVLQRDDWTPTADSKLLLNHTADPASDAASVHRILADSLFQAWFIGGGDACRRLANAVVRAFRERQPDTSILDLFNAIMHRISERLQTEVPVSKTDLLSSTSLTKMVELQKPTRAAASRLADDIKRALASALE